MCIDKARVYLIILNVYKRVRVREWYIWVYIYLCSSLNGSPLFPPVTVSTGFTPSAIYSIHSLFNFLYICIYLSISITKKLQLLIKIPLLLPLVVLLSDWSFSVKILQLLIYFLLGHSLKTILTTCFIGLYIAWQMETAAYPDAGSILNWQIDEGRYDI